MNAQLPAVGSLVVDELSGKTGVLMEVYAGRAMLRPVGGGREWETFPEKVVPAEGAA